MFKAILSSEIEKDLIHLKKRNTRLFQRIITAIEEITKDPGCGKPLMGNLKGYYSYRIGDYRIIFELDTKTSTIYLEYLAHRKEAYRRR